MTPYDVIVLGSGIAGSTVAAVLAKDGYKVLMLEKGKHPRFALGEATLPQTSYWLWFIAERYGLPELKHLSRAESVCQHVSKSCGIKRSIGFTYHHEGQPLDMRRESHQFLAPELPFLSESHYLRADIDSYMVGVAESYGAIHRQQVTVSELDCREDGVMVMLESGESFSGRYLVDATGYHSLLAQRYNLRENPTALHTRSRTIFTHVSGLQPFDKLFAKNELPGLKYRFHDGTLHHVFDGGWLWVIPFDNHAGSNNASASLGLSLDLGKFPPSGLEPETEFWQLVSRFPSIQAHLEGVQPTRPWVGTGRLQYSSKRCLGPRFYLTAQAYGAVDALYSRGMISTFEALYVFLGRLQGALAENDFSAERFGGLEALHHRQLVNHDQMVSSAYRAMAHFETWNAWTKVWIASKLYGDLWLLRTSLRYLAGGDCALLEGLESSAAPFTAQMQELIDKASSALSAVAAKTLTPEAAAKTILDALEASDWLPHHVYAWGKADVHHGDFTGELTMPRAILWGKTRAPKWIRENLFDFPVSPLLRLKLSEKLGREVNV